MCGSPILAKWVTLLCTSTAAAQVVPEPQNNAGVTAPPRFEWSKALRQSGVFLGIQHTFRIMTEPGSRAELRGPYLKDYCLAVSDYGSRRDGDNLFTNYLGHPMMGASSGWIYVQNDP